MRGRIQESGVVVRKQLRAFTLIEILIVVTILGILAAIVIPQFGDAAERAKESAAKDTLHTVRVQIGYYSLQHNGAAPGYLGMMQAPLATLSNQFVGTSSVTGAAVASTVRVKPYVYGPYLNKLPVNPFNNLVTFKYVPVGVEFEDAADGQGGWLYKKETSEIRLNWMGSDSVGVGFSDY